MIAMSTSDAQERCSDSSGNAAFSASTEVAADCAAAGRTGSVAPRCWSSTRIQLRSVSRLIPRSSAIAAIVAPGRDRYNATASALNSGG